MSIAFIFLAILLHFDAQSLPNQSANTFDKIIQEIENYEYITDNIYLKIDWRHECDKSVVDIPKKFNVSSNTHVTTTCISQDSMIYFKYWHESSDESMQSKPVTHFEAFDGNVYRSKYGSICTLSNRIENKCIFIKPHDIVFINTSTCACFSKRLKGGLELQRHSSKRYEGEFRRSKIDGEDVLLGQPCLRIRTDIFSSDGKILYATNMIWLAKNCAFMPLKMRGTKAGEDPLHGVGEEGIVEELREIESGIWVPIRGTITCRLDIKGHKNYGKTTNIASWKILECNLSPSFPKSQFQDIPFPEGAKLYEITNGNITNEYIIGSQGHGGMINWISAIITLAISVAGALYYYYSRTRRKNARNSVDLTDSAM